MAHLAERPIHAGAVGTGDVNEGLLLCCEFGASSCPRLLLGEDRLRGSEAQHGPDEDEDHQPTRSIPSRWTLQDTWASTAIRGTIEYACTHGRCTFGRSDF
jgi:hypothetical protein